MYSLSPSFPDMDKNKYEEMFCFSYHYGCISSSSPKIFIFALQDALLWGHRWTKVLVQRASCFWPSSVPLSRSCLHKNWGCSLAYNGSSLKKEKNYRMYKCILLISDASSLTCWKVMFSISDSRTLIFTLWGLLLWNVYQCTCNREPWKEK